MLRPALGSAWLTIIEFVDVRLRFKTSSVVSVMQETSYGVLRPPLGSVRLTIIELVAVLVRTGSPAAEAAVMASSAVQEVLQVFLRFPFNSILHHQARSSSPSMSLAASLCKCRILALRADDAKCVHSCCGVIWTKGCKQVGARPATVVIRLK